VNGNLDAGLGQALRQAQAPDAAAGDDNPHCLSSPSARRGPARLVRLAMAAGSQGITAQASCQI
jgi:hypothetical protein